MTDRKKFGIPFAAYSSMLPMLETYTGILLMIIHQKITYQH